MKLKLMPIRLNYFEGEGAPSGDSNSGTPDAKGEAKQILYGKQAEAIPTQTQQEVAAPKNETKVSSDTLEAKRKAYDDYIKGEGKQFYTEDTQKMINKRFKETKDLESRLADVSPIMEMLRSRYGKTDTKDILSALESDNALWEEAADEAGMTVEQYRNVKKLERENEFLKQQQERAEGQAKADQQVQAWMQEEEAMKLKFPNFSLRAEIEGSEQFQKLLTSGVGIEAAYKAVHFDELADGIVQNAMRDTEKKVTDTIRSKGNRPVEAGSSAQSAFIVKNDVHALSREDRRNIARKVAMGEKIEF